MDITNIVSAGIGIVYIIIACFVLPILFKNYGADKVRTATDTLISNFGTLKTIADLAVEAAEQIFHPNESHEKKKYAEEFVNKKLEEAGLTYDKQTIDATIESCVLGLHNKLYGSTKVYTPNTNVIGIEKCEENFESEMENSESN